MNRFEDALKDNVLSVILVDHLSDSRACLIKMLAAVGTDWVVLSQDKLWECPGVLQLQVRQLLKARSKVLNGWLQAMNHLYCLTEAGLSEFMRDALLSLRQNEVKFCLLR